MLDVVIRGGDVVDGSGAPRRRADVGIAGNRIVQIGDVTAEARRTIDAAGRVVAPGFIDVHTHYDAQVFWDGALTPSPQFGFTTAFAGNCGFSIAPLPRDADGAGYLLRMLARVEAIPRESLEQGVPWDWHTTGEYLDAVDGRVAMNIGFMVGHSAIRRCVMGADASRRAATADELLAMQRLLAEGLEAGGIGFSSTWARTHNDAEGQMVPSRHAEREELLALARVLAAHEGTSLEFIPMIAPVSPFEPWAFELMADMSAAAQRPLNWNLLPVDAGTYDEAVAKLEAADIARQRGGEVYALTIPKSLAFRLSFSNGFILEAFPGWEALFAAAPADRIAALRDPAERARLAAGARSPQNRVPQFTAWANMQVFDVAAPQNEQHRGRLLGEIAAEHDRDPFDVLCDIAATDELRTSFGLPEVVETRDDWMARLKIWRDGRAVLGGSDAGAHLEMQTGFDYPTKVLARAVRGHGLLSVEEAVHYFTDVPARLYGLRERGRLEEGWYADVVVFDPQRIGDGDARMVYDMPGGAGRLYADPVGIEHVIVNGTEVVDRGGLTDARPGTVIRSGRDTTASAR